MESRSLYQHHSLRVNSTRTHAHSVGQPALRKSLYTAHWYQHTWGYRPFHIHTLWDIAIYWSLLVLELIESWLHCWLRYLVFHNWCATERQWLVFWGGGVSFMDWLTHIPVYLCDSYGHSWVSSCKQQVVQYVCVHVHLHTCSHVSVLMHFGMFVCVSVCVSLGNS